MRTEYFGFNGYRGSRCWECSHPEHETVVVRAATANQALIACAYVWHRDWKPVAFHSQVKIRERPDIQQTLEGAR